MVLSNDSKYLNDSGGTFYWRVVAGTNRLSLHSFGIAIDINVEYSNYWLWDYKKALGIPSSTNVNAEDVDYSKFPAYRNQIPWKIAQYTT
ncbi:M15 family metallopeptidase [Candidatus Tisiphia endosymbiont of Nedyus quadrimaculatus]|uniref:M15 family metallopeptidase n=1 Tax=Candidatus Tisiphia endosymbiont of Nedyus quadrimaculatus TaxID=3139332 RepID=UPI00345EE9BC